MSGHHRRPKLTYSLGALATATALATALAVAGGLGPVVSWAVAITVVTFGLYGLDKRRASNARFRIPEFTLQLVGLCGGTPGAFMAQRLFRHKTRKTSFQVVFWAVVAVQACVGAWLLAAA